jgi:hypothetical protein
VLDAFSAEDAVDDVYKDAPDPRLIRRFDAAAADLDAALGMLERDGAPADRRLARRARSLHAAYAGRMRRSFQASDAGDEARAETLAEAGDEAQDELQPLLNGVGPTNAIAQLRAIDGSRRRRGASSA